MKTYKLKHEMNDGDTVAGVVYAVAAEQVIRQLYDQLTQAQLNQSRIAQPTVIGYMVEVDDEAGMDDADGYLDSWSQVDLDRKTVLINLPSLSQTELRELAAINRRLDYDVTG